jgi:hypothetical protein
MAVLFSTGGLLPNPHHVRGHYLRYTARGFRNRENFKTAIYFHCGGLDLYPH